MNIFKKNSKRAACLMFSPDVFFLGGGVKTHRSPIPYTPLCLGKAVKNATEIQGMKMAHVRITDP